MDTTSIMAQLGLSVFAVGLIIVLALLFSSYVKIVTVLGIVRAGFGVHSFPSAFVTGGLAIALSMLVMAPVIQSSSEAIDVVVQRTGAMLSDKDKAEAINSGLSVWKQFLSRNAHADQKEKFVAVAKTLDEKNQVTGQPIDSESWRILAPAFFVSELKEAFMTGLSIFLPLLVIDLLIANILIALGLTQVNPVLVALPCKLAVFVLADGWTLITTNLIGTYVG